MDLSRNIDSCTVLMKMFKIEIRNTISFPLTKSNVMQSRSAYRNAICLCDPFSLHIIPISKAMIYLISGIWL